MSSAVTFEDVWKMFQESVREYDRRSQESREEWERRLQKDREEWERRLQKDREESEQFHRQRMAEIGTMFADSKKENESIKKENDRIISNLAKQMGDLSDKWGKFVEGLVAPACKTLFAAQGIKVHKVFPRVEINLEDGRNMEIDLLVVNVTAAVLVEVKSTLTIADVRHHIKRLKQFKAFLPEYADKKVYGAVASIVAGDSAIRFAHNQGLFIIAQSGETVCLANTEGFVPRIW